MAEPNMIPLSFHFRNDAELQQRSREFRDEMRGRRTVRDFSDRPIAREVIDNCLLVAGGAPSGANLQPWHFVVVSDPVAKRRMQKSVSFTTVARRRNGSMRSPRSVPTPTSRSWKPRRISSRSLRRPTASFPTGER